MKRRAVPRHQAQIQRLAGEMPLDGSSLANQCSGRNTGHDARLTASWPMVLTEVLGPPVSLRGNQHLSCLSGQHLEPQHEPDPQHESAEIAADGDKIVSKLYFAAL